MDRNAADLLAQAARYGMAYGVVFLDLDHFKVLNDMLGHPMGDAALKKVVAVAQAALRPTDLIARIGGDEFLLLLHDRSEADARQLVETIVKTVASEALTHGRGSPRVSISAGLLWVGAKAPAQNLPALIKAADQLMYQAKHAGGNQLAHTLLAQSQAA